MSRKPSRNRRRRAATVNRLEAQYRRRDWEAPGTPTFFRGFQDQPLYLPHRREWQAGTRTFATKVEAQAYLRWLK